mgnify:FL=1
MNKARRKKIERIVTIMKAFKEDLEMLRDEEEQAYDNTPDSFKDCEKGERAEEIVESLSTAPDCVEEALSELESVL